MSSGVDSFLKKTLGEDFFESLQKFELWKPGTKTTVDHEEIRTALQIVPRTIIALLIRELGPMAIGDTKEVNLFFASSARMTATKHERDVYSGDIYQDNKKVVDFKFRTLPGVGLVIMSAFELYDMENLINTQQQPAPDLADHAHDTVQRVIEERLALHGLIDKVVDKKISERDAVHSMLLMKLTEELEKEHKKNKHIAEVRQIQEESTPQSEEYFRGMTNGLEVANCIANEKEPQFVNPKKVSPLKGFLESRKSRSKEFSIEIKKGESVSCPDCRKNIFDGQVFSGCVCLGDDMERKLFVKKSEDGVTVRFSRGWDQENIEMLLEVLRRKRG